MAKAKAYTGLMTSPVQLLYKWNKGAISFRSENPLGNVSYLYVKHTKHGIYCLCETADILYYMAKANPTKTIYRLQENIPEGDHASEIHEILNDYIYWGFGDLIPQIILDGDRR